VCSTPKRSTSNGTGGPSAGTTFSAETITTNRRLARLRGAPALHQPSSRVDLVGAVDRDVELTDRVEVFNDQTQRPGRLFGCRRGGHAAQAAQAPCSERRQQIGDR
jgi:hypothetical protein